MPERFDDGGGGEFLASQMTGTFSEEAARKLCFEQENQLRVLRQEVEYRKKRDERLTAVAAELTGKLADAEIENQRLREAVKLLHPPTGLTIDFAESLKTAAESATHRIIETVEKHARQWDAGVYHGNPAANALRELGLWKEPGE